MKNFAENSNLGKRVLPPPPHLRSLYTNHELPHTFLPVHLKEKQNIEDPDSKKFANLSFFM